MTTTNIEHQDTVALLKECDSGSKMAVTSIEEVLEKVKQSALKNLLAESKKHHEKLGNEIHCELLLHGSGEKDPHPMAKGMSSLKTTVKMAMDSSDFAIAELITDGCDMGIKSLHKYKNQYKHADHASRDLCNRLISIEEALKKELYPYL